MHTYLQVISAPFVNFVTFCFFAILIGGHIFWLLERNTASAPPSSRAQHG
jgi:uncharacterized membrane protein YvlD (DUF360 family)